MNPRTLLLLGILVPTLSLNVAQALDIETSALLDFQAAINTDSGSRQLMQASAEPELNVRFDNGIRFTAIGRIRLQSIDGLQADNIDRRSYSSATKPSLLGNDLSLELREFFIETSVGDDYLTFGKQQVVWGKADGLKVLDVVNPQSFREFILEDFEKSRIPLWTVNYEWQLSDDSTLQFLWIPDQSMHALPDDDATYRFTSRRLVPTAPAGVAVNIKDIDRPSRVLKDSDFGLRWSAFIDGWDLTLNYLYHYDDLPVYFQQLNVSSTGATVTISPEYKRSHLVGGTFSNAFGNLTVRGEIGYSSDKYFLSNNPNDNNGVVNSDEVSYVLGFDWFGFEETLLSVQLFQSIILNPSSGIIRPSTDTNVTFLLQKDFLNETLTVEMLALQNLNDKDGFLRPKISYDWGDDLKIWLGADIFYGDKDGLFGEFDKNDQILFGIEQGF